MEWAISVRGSFYTCTGQNNARALLYGYELKFVRGSFWTDRETKYRTGTDKILYGTNFVRIYREYFSHFLFLPRTPVHTNKNEKIWYIDIENFVRVIPRTYSVQPRTICQAGAKGKRGLKNISYIYDKFYSYCL